METRMNIFLEFTPNSRLDFDKSDRANGLLVLNSGPSFIQLSTENEEIEDSFNYRAELKKTTNFNFKAVRFACGRKICEI